LSIVYEIVEAMGGSVEARSDRERSGTAISVRLPADVPVAPTM
jgi:signal transduction histidine kinase